MRTSGVESDLLLFMIPVLVLTVLAVAFMGGPARALDILDSSVLDTLHWLRHQWSLRLL